MYAITYVEIDVPSFDATSPVGTQTFRFAIPTDYLPATIDCIPSIDNVSFNAALVSLGKDLGQRAKITVTLADHRHIFNGEAYSAGTFWGKWRGRYGTTLRGRPLRVIRGQVGQTLAQMDTRHYVIETTAGPDPTSGKYVIEAKDILKFADDDRALAPMLSSGSLAGSISNSATSLTLSPAGIGNAEYPASGYVCVGGNEVMSFTRSADVLTITRAQFGSVASAHDAGDRVQIVLRYAGDTAADIIHDLLTTYAAVDASYIDLTEWQDEVNAYLGVLYARTICEPTPVRKLIAELIEQAALAVWWDDRALRIRLAVLREIATDTAEFNEQSIIAGSMRVGEQPSSRISQIWTYYGTRDPTDLGAEEDNFRAALADVDLAKETEYGSAEIARIMGTWIETEGAATRLNAIQLSRFQDPPRNFRFSLVAGETVSLAQGYTLAWWANQNALGVAQPAKIQITKVDVFSDRVEVEAEEMLASGDLPSLVNTVFLTDTGAVNTWTVPATWNDADNRVAVIAGGAGGATSGLVNSRCGGGGGGAYSHVDNISLTPAASISYRVGAGGAAFANGEDTWFGNAVYASATVGAKGGVTGSGRFGGAGGAAASGIGDVKYSGGAGGTGGPAGESNTGEGGGGGGGAAGPHGNGSDGGVNTSIGDDGGSGGGGADNGFDGAQADGTTGGGGGNNRFNFGGGAAGQAGDEGGGGGGGNTGEDGGPGGAGEQIWTQTVNPITSAGPGGGGGGGGDDAAGAVGGLYGGGGGGGDLNQSAAGAQGIIVISWREP